MDDNVRTPLSLRELARRKREKTNFFFYLLDASGFLIMFGMLIGATGLISFLGFFNMFSRVMLTIGFIITLFGFAGKLIDVVLKLIGVRS